MFISPISHLRQGKQFPSQLEVNFIMVIQFNGRTNVRSIRADKWKEPHAVISDKLLEWRISINI